MTSKKIPITVAYGDGIGPEIMEATLKILEASGASLDIEKVEMGEKLYLSGHPTGISEEAFQSIRRTRVFLKSPMTTPQGGGYRSLNVTIRTRLGLYANVRPALSFAPYVATKHPEMDLVIVRENEEDLYAGIEYQQTPDVTHASKLISRPGSERIIRFAFEYARQMGRKKVTAMAKDNILKITDGLFHKIFLEIGEAYSDIEKEFFIIDIGCARLADTPEHFDVIVLPNLYGDILSDVANQITGSVGLGGSGNYGTHAAMFEAVHGSAPKKAGQNSANPSGLLFGAIQMLVHIHQIDVANRIQNSWLKTIEDGVHTPDLYKEGVSKERVGTREFAQAVIDRLGQMPSKLKAAHFEPLKKEPPRLSIPSAPAPHRELVGVDLFLHSYAAVEKIARELLDLSTPSLKLSVIANRGVKVWPEGIEETGCISEWRCRFFGNGKASAQAIASLMHRLADAGLDVVRLEMLYTFDGKEGFSAIT